MFMWGDVKTAERTTRLPTRVPLPDSAAARTVAFGAAHRLILGTPWGRERERKGEGERVIERKEKKRREKVR